MNATQIRAEIPLTTWEYETEKWHRHQHITWKSLACLTSNVLHKRWPLTQEKF